MGTIGSAIVTVAEVVALVAGEEVDMVVGIGISIGHHGDPQDQKQFGCLRMRVLVKQRHITECIIEESTAEGSEYV